MPFNFLELPQEIRDMIFTEYINCEGLKIKGRLSTTRRRKVYFEDIPSLAIELVCQKFNTNVKQLRSQLWPRKLHFDEDMFSDAITHVGTDIKYTWLHHRIQHISAGHLGRLNLVGAFKFQNLRSLTVNELGNSNLDARHTSFEAWKNAHAGDDPHRTYFAGCYRRVIEVLSGGRAEGVDLILIGKGGLKDSDSVVEVHTTFNYTKDEKHRYFHTNLVSKEFLVNGKEINPEHYDLMETSFERGAKKLD